MANRRSNLYPRVHHHVVELILLALLFHGALKFLYWLFSDLNLFYLPAVSQGGTPSRDEPLLSLVAIN